MGAASHHSEHAERAKPHSQRANSNLQASRLARLQAGLAIGFGVPLLIGIVYRAGLSLGWSSGLGAVSILVELGVITALLILVLRYEHLPLGSIGIHRLRAEEVYFGVAVGLALIIVSGGFAELMARTLWSSSGLSLLDAMAPATSQGKFAAPVWIGLLAAIASVMAEELAARGYAIRRLRGITGATFSAAVLALTLDVIARLPLWGLVYTLVTLPAEVLLVALFLWRRQLMPAWWRILRWC